jgi:predicted nucleotidyltransferase
MKTIDIRTILTVVEQKTLDRAILIIRKHLPDSEIILYGSRARGEAKDDSDYDILVITEGKKDHKIKNVIYDELSDIFMETDQWVSAFIIDRESWESPVAKGSPFYKEVSHEGIVL